MQKKDKLYPLIFKPVLKNYIWGGRNLEKLGRTLPSKGIIAESWDIAAHKDGTTKVANGYYSGYSLVELQNELKLDLIGSNNLWAQKRDKFPLLIKLLDANRPLSVQVHPNDKYALLNEGNELGKTEMWVVLHAKEKAELILGVNKKTTPENFRKAIQVGNLEDYLHHLPVKTGDHICVPAGTLHAIMDGIIIAEIQQNSNTTYRVYDWNRVDAKGNQRPLHIDKALGVINFEQKEPKLSAPKLISHINGIKRSMLCQTPYFTTEKIEMDSTSTYKGFCSGETLEIWGVIEGKAKINKTQLNATGFALLPAKMGEFEVFSEKKTTLLRIYVEKN